MTFFDEIFRVRKLRGRGSVKVCCIVLPSFKCTLSPMTFLSLNPNTSSSWTVISFLVSPSSLLCLCSLLGSIILSFMPTFVIIPAVSELVVSILSSFAFIESEFATSKSSNSFSSVSLQLSSEIGWEGSFNKFELFIGVEFSVLFKVLVQLQHLFQY
ncbi:hypothetical protein FF38_01847 [Lucilia cuprina]|uniref:Uncharacterized protein n=1 Tax=Lucilia cuprina TaxID=7375 RepID=A0A0L0BQ87_LUCCU|nr:hypothetical protein FF38_01847 [Lucilia cuprina]